MGREDSNLRIRDPKSRALPLGHAPETFSPRHPYRRSRQRADRPAIPSAPRQPPADLPRVLERARDAEHRRPAARHQRAQRAGRQQRRPHPPDRRGRGPPPPPPPPLEGPPPPRPASAPRGPPRPPS